MDVHTLVKTVIQTFEDSANLVRRIQQKRDASDAPALPEEPMNDLLGSLALGPVIVRGHYDHDLKRFGEPYSCGDRQAQDALKDILIHLQIMLITGLHRVWMDDGDIDFDAAQSASDDGRVNAGVCLGQLSQRLSDAAKARSMQLQHNGMYAPGSMLSPSMTALQYSSSRSTNSSGFSRAQTMTPSTVADEFGNMKLQTHPLLAPHRPVRERNTSTSSSSSLDPAQRWSQPFHRPGLTPAIQERVSSMTGDATSLRRPSSHCLAPEDSQLLSPSSYHRSPQLSPRQTTVEPDGRNTPLQSGQELSPQMSRTSSSQHGSNGIDIHSPDHISNRTPSLMTTKEYPSYASHWEARQARSPLSQQSYRGITSNGEGYNTMEHVQYLQRNARPPVADVSRFHSISRAQLRESQYTAQSPPPHGIQRLEYPIDQQGRQQMPQEYYSRPSVSGLILVENQNFAQTNHTPRQHILPKPSIVSLTPSHNTATAIGRPMSITTSSSTTGPLILPTDKNNLGFCKGAFRLFIGLEKKAFSINNRPLGVSGLIPYWKCEKCTFEGPCIINVLPGQKRSKAEKLYDPKIREWPAGAGDATGIRYKWAFLAKCHIATKAVPELGSPEQRRGEYGSFGCIFCACEAQRRGWALSGNDIYTDADKVPLKKGGKKSDSLSFSSERAGGGTPIFGNVQSFMEHLQVHRREEMRPGVEMCGRLNAVVGRVPEREEEFDVALLPL